MVGTAGIMLLGEVVVLEEEWTQRAEVLQEHTWRTAAATARFRQTRLDELETNVRAPPEFEMFDHPWLDA
jgi:hypothetical protein